MQKRKFIVIDGYGQIPFDVEADDHEEAARHVATDDVLAQCLSPVLQKAKHQQATHCKGAVMFCDEASNEGWGKGCKFEGQGHLFHKGKRQVFVTVIER